MKFINTKLILISALLVSSTSLFSDDANYSKYMKAYENGNYESALKYSQKALKADLKMYDTMSEEVALAYNDMGFFYEKLKRYKKSLKAHKKALSIRSSLLGIGHPDTVASYNNIAAVYNSMGNNIAALKYMNKALDMCQSTLGYDHPNTLAVQSSVDALIKKQRVAIK
jgi:tetratricopeptide (TPR) repeat protein